MNKINVFRCDVLKNTQIAHEIRTHIAHTQSIHSPKSRKMPSVTDYFTQLAHFYAWPHQESLVQAR